MRRLFILLLLQTAALSLAAQSIPINPKRGHVSKEEVALTTYPLDTAAAALILHENIESSIAIDGRGQIIKKYEYYVRYKILKEAGKSYADEKVAYDKDEHFSSINVVTYNLEGDKVQKSKLERKYIYREKVDDETYTCSFSAPDVRVGSVVEISYVFDSPYYYNLPTLDLQHDIPSNSVYASFSCPDFIYTKKMVLGFSYPQYSKESYPLPANLGLNGFVNTDIYTMVDVPALRKEGHVLCPSQYNTHVSYTISQIVIPGYVYEDITKKWSNLDQSFRKSNAWTQCQAGGRMVEAFKSSNEDEVKAIEEVRKAVLDAVKFNGNYAVSYRTIKDILKEGSGNSGAINIIVASTLNEMGYMASPVLLRQRSQGVLTDTYVRMNAYTDMILQIQTPSGKVYYMDAADKNGYLNVLDPDFLVDKARVIPIIPEQFGHFEKLTPYANGSSMTMVSATLEEDGVIRGKMILNANGEESYMIKQTYHNQDSDEKYIELISEGEDFEAVSYNIECNDFSNSVVVNVDVEQVPTEGGEFLYINPFLIKNHHESDFPDIERHMPIDFYFLENETYRYMLTIPENYEVAELPKTVAFVSNAIQARVMCQATVKGQLVMVQCHYSNKKLLALAEDYPEIRNFWEQLCNIYNAKIVLKKKAQ